MKKYYTVKEFEREITLPDRTRRMDSNIPSGKLRVEEKKVLKKSSHRRALR